MRWFGHLNPKMIRCRPVECGGGRGGVGVGKLRECVTDDMELFGLQPGGAIFIIQGYVEKQHMEANV